jgi:hypothetical protein
MELSKEVDDWCKYEALGQCLTEWGNRSYEEVVQQLYYLDTLKWSENEEEIEAVLVDLLIWEPFEDLGWSWVADQIESMYKSYIECAKFVLKENNND